MHLKYIVMLTNEERQRLRAWNASGKGPARKRMHAWVLLKAERRRKTSGAHDRDPLITRRTGRGSWNQGVPADVSSITRVVRLPMVNRSWPGRSWAATLEATRASWVITAMPARWRLPGATSEFSGNSQDSQSSW